MNLESFKVSKLHASMPDCKLLFTDNTLLLIGENGSGKTTLMKMLFYTLSAQWLKLLSYEFDSIEVVINAEIFFIKRSELESAILDPQYLRTLPVMIRRRMSGNIDIDNLRELCERYDIPIDVIFQEFENEVSEVSDERHNNTINILRKLRRVLKDTLILYLPTYRRIEQDLKVVLGDKVDDDSIRRRNAHMNTANRNYAELVEFGMGDVDEAVKNTLSTLRRSYGDSLNSLSLSYLSEIITERYKRVDNSYLNDIDESTILNVVDRVDETILSMREKQLLSEKILGFKNTANIETDTDKVVCHYFEKLYQTHKDLKDKETPIRMFATICGKYFKNKEVLYDSTNFDFKIKPEFSDKPIGLGCLSSGEKQIAALFSLILLGNRSCFIIIDEPELSLSVKWQRQFLDDIHKSPYCKGLFAVTHSPFIFDNELDKYAHGMDEFRIVE